MCEPSSGAKTLRQRGSNNVVAVANKVLGANMDYCGKKMVITNKAGKVFDQFFIWDGCEACNSDGHMDFSSTGRDLLFYWYLGEPNPARPMLRTPSITFSTGFGDIVGASRCAEGSIANEISWKV
ncbi:hypothetical protein T439DRAFT_323897 [Meredithblackwellia eburnea MCA 4105]